MRSKIILTTLVLLAATTLSLVVFTHVKQEAAVSGFTSKVLEEHLSQKVERIFEDLEKEAFMTAGVVARHPRLIVENRDLVTYLLNTLSIHSHHDEIRIVTPRGDAFIASDKTERAAFTITSLPSGTINYYNKQRKFLASERDPSLASDLRESPWYQSAEEKHKLAWHVNQETVTAAIPIYKAQELMAVVAVDLAMSRLEEMLGASVLQGSHSAIKFPVRVDSDWSIVAAAPVLLNNLQEIGSFALALLTGAGLFA